jgi:hypothetical protein
MSHTVSAVSPVSDIARDEVFALFADPLGASPAGNEDRLSMDILEIAQEQPDEEDETVVFRISASVPV